MTCPRLVSQTLFSPGLLLCVNAQRKLRESLDLRGRILVLEHGINGTVGGEVDVAPIGECEHCGSLTKNFYN